MPAKTVRRGSTSMCQWPLSCSQALTGAGPFERRGAGGALRQQARAPVRAARSRTRFRSGARAARSGARRAAGRRTRRSTTRPSRSTTSRSPEQALPRGAGRPRTRRRRPRPDRRRRLARARRAAVWLCGRLAPASRALVQERMHVGKARLHARLARARARRPRRRRPRPRVSSANERTCRGVETTTS